MTTQKKRKGFRLLLWGMVFGVVFGFGIRWLESFIAAELVQLLKDEAQASCPCSFEIDEIEMSLLTMSARGKNGRVLLDGKPQLLVRNLFATFRPWERITRRKIVLKRLVLDEVEVDGVGVSSGTFQFINHLAEPSDPAKDHPLKFTVALLEMVVTNARFKQPLGAGSLTGQGVSLQYRRDRIDNLLLSPRVSQLSFEQAGKLPIEIGGLSGSLYITDDAIEFQKITLAAQNAFASLKATVLPAQDHSLDGEMEFGVAANSSHLPGWLSLPISGKAQLSGQFSSPDVEGSLALPTNQRASIKDGDSKVVTFNQGGASFSLKNEDELLISSGELIGDLASLRLDDPLALSPDKISGAFRFEIAEFSLRGNTVRNLFLLGSLSGTSDTPLLALKGTIGEVTRDGYYLPPLSLSARASVRGIEGEIVHQSKELGTLSLNVRSSITNDRFFLEQFDFSFEQFALLQALEGEQAITGDPLRVTGSGNMTGPLELEALEGEAQLVFTSPDFSGEAALAGTAQLKVGTLSVALTNESDSISSSLELPLVTDEAKPGALIVRLKEFQPQEYDPSLSCLLFDLEVRYEFFPSAALEGNGTIDLQKSALGCSPHTIHLSSPTQIPIRFGTLDLPELRLSGEDASVNLGGNISLNDGYDLKLSAELELESLLPYATSLDDLRGRSTVQAQITGPLDSPRFRGAATLSNSELAIEEANISLTRITGSLEIEPHRVNIRSIAGEVNGGTFELAGEIFPFELPQSNLGLSFQNLFLEPRSDLQASISGELFLTQGEALRPAIAGTVTIDSAALKKSFDLRTFLGALPRYLLSRSESDDSVQPTALPEIELDLRVKATRNVFILTTFLGAELAGDLFVRGTLAEPRINGSLQTLNGWFGLRDTRFQITSGQILLGAVGQEPTLDLVSETYANSLSGDDTLIILEAKGPLSSPKITLSSNRGLTPNEILTLVSAGRVGFQQDGSRFFTSGLQFEEREETEVGVQRLVQLFRRLTRIDNLSVAPKVNRRRGTLEPALIAEKQIFPKLDLLGETFLSGSGDEALVTLRYELSDSLNLLGTADTITAEDTTAFGIDLEYVILERQGAVVTYAISGNKELSEDELLQELRVSRLSRIRTEAVAKLGDQARENLRKRGYLNAEATATCLEGNYHCRRIQLEITEGPRYTISELKFFEQPLPKDFEKRIFTPINLPATAENRDRLVKSLTDAFRSEGFLQMRATAEYVPDQSRKGSALLRVGLRIGAPVSFLFEGNSVFSSEEFLETINLFDRKQPFGNNTIRILIENIDRKYRQAGYLFATVSSEKVISREQERTIYRVVISEEQKVKVTSVEIEGMKAFSLEEVKSLIRKHPEPTLFEKIFSPTAAVTEELDAHSRALEGILQEEGFPQATVTPSILPHPTLPEVRIVYTIEEGRPRIADTVELRGFPEELGEIEPLEPPYSIPKINRHIFRLVEQLQSSGFFDAEVTTDSAAERIIIQVKAGRQHRLAQVTIRGQNEISEQVIRSQLKLQPGMAWNEELFAEARRRLLRLGTFSRVSFQRVPLSELESELVIRVAERPLQTLELGTGINSEFGLHLFGEATDRSLFADGRTLGLRFDTYYDDTAAEISQGLASLRFIDPSFIDDLFVFSHELRYQRLDLSTQEFDLDRVSFLTFLFRDFSEGVTANIGHTIFQEDLEDVSPGAIIGEFDEGVVDLSIVSGNIIYDKRNDQLNPLSGYRFRFDWALASELIGSDANYLSVGGLGSYTLPFEVDTNRFAFATRLSAASAFTFDGTDEVPISQRFYAGGRNTVRGFRENSLGPRGADGAVIGGDLSVIGNNEFRYFLTDTLSSHLFFDIGTVYLKDRSTNFDALRKSAGFGLRYLSAIGPVGFDIGKPLDEEEGEPSVRIHFSLGTNF